MIHSKQWTRLAVLMVLAVTLSGCETFLLKFKRDKGTPEARPLPVFRYQNYGKDMTPAERYQKAFGQFDYWQEQLLVAVSRGSMNAKTIRHASFQSLDALKKMQDLLPPEYQEKMVDVLEQRTNINADFELGKFNGYRMHQARRILEAQERKIRREFALKDVQSVLQETAKVSSPQE